MDEVKKGTLSLTSVRQEVGTRNSDFSSFASLVFFPPLPVVRRDFNKVLRPVSSTELQKLFSCHSSIHHWVSLAKHLLTVMNRNLPMQPQETRRDFKGPLLTEELFFNLFFLIKLLVESFSFLFKSGNGNYQKVTYAVLQSFTTCSAQPFLFKCKCL